LGAEPEFDQPDARERRSEGVGAGDAEGRVRLGGGLLDHPGEKPSSDRRGAISAPAGKAYKEILEAAGIKGDEVSKLIANGKLAADTPGIEALQSVLGEANEGAAAAWPTTEAIGRLEVFGQFRDAGGELEGGQDRLYQAAQPGWDEKKTQREQRNSRAAMMQPMMMAGGPAAPSPWNRPRPLTRRRTWRG
jgi:hypothetical protein